jgi:hypothetical protein
MCGRCGLIFDYQFDAEDEQPGWPQFEPPLSVMEQWEDEQGNMHFDEPERRELCPRCGADFSVDKFMPVAVSEYDFGNFTQTTFVVEDNCHATVLREIAIQLNKDKEVMVLEADNSENVKSFFRLAKRQGVAANAYFIVDGDNKDVDKEFANEPNYIHLDRYCIESYLFDIQVVSAMCRKAERIVRRALVKILKTTSQKSTKSPTAEKLLLQFLRQDVVEKVLTSIDTSKVLPAFHQEMGFSSRDKYIEEYVKEAAQMSKLGHVFPSRLVKAVRNAKGRP